MTSSDISVKRVRPLLGTYVEVELTASTSEALLHRCISRGYQVIERVDQLMSVHRPESDISRLNHANPGTWIRIHPWTAQVLATAQALYKASDGVFDVRRPPVQSTPGAPFDMQGRRVRKNGPWTFDLGGIAKGFAVDQAVARMREFKSAKHLSGIVNAGGDLRLWGAKTRHVALRIEGASGAHLESFAARSVAVASSAFRGHSLRALTPAIYPVRKNAPAYDSVTVFAARCWVADALTKIVLLGKSRVARRCLSAYQAQAVVYTQGSQKGKVLN